MKIIHVLRDGTRVDDISGHVVKTADAEQLYQYIHSINQGKGQSNKIRKNEVRV